MSEFLKSFYPTPVEVIKKMLEPYRVPEDKRDRYNDYSTYKLSDKYILEPSAGKGDILTFISEKLRYNRGIDLYACEINPELQPIIQDKGYKLIGNDFLQLETDILFDMIIMNPPFDKGDEHLLKAWKILEDGDIICLLNSETINNPYTKQRKLLKSIIDKHGSVEDLGTCFDTAERKTNVNVSLVRLHKVSEDSKFSFQFESRGTEDQPDLSEETIKDNKVAINDVIGSIVIQYKQIQNAFIEYMKTCDMLKFYERNLVSQYTNSIEIAQEAYKERNKKTSFNKFSANIKSEAWRYVIAKAGIQKYMTSRTSKEFDKFVQQQGDMPFTRENIYGVIKLIIENSGEILERAIEDAFDLMTRYDDKNRIHVEGWKTNDSYKVNQKVILPYVVRYGEYSDSNYLRTYGDNFNINYDYHSDFFDIDKALSYMTGKSYDHIYTIHRALENKFNDIGRIKTGDKFENTCSSTFFHIKFWKKGTVHLTFRDKKVWEDFNIRAARMKKWLPEAEYDEWKRKRNGQTVIKKEMRIESPKARTEVEQLAIF